MRGSLYSPVDVRVPCNPGSLGRMFQLTESGCFRLARRSAVFGSIMIASAGSFGRVTIRAGNLRPLWGQPSMFTGSFVLNVGAEDGLIVEAISESPPSATICWREPDGELF